MTLQDDKSGLDKVLGEFLQEYNSGTNVNWEENLRREVCEEYRKAEELIKRLEQETLGEDSLIDVSDSKVLYLPAINELRYAGSALATVVVDKEPGERLQNLWVALFHSLRAFNDAYYVAILYLIGKCEEFQNDYKGISITSSEINDYVSKRESWIEIRNKIRNLNPEDNDQAARAGGSIRAMKELAKKREEQYEKLKGIYDSFEAVRDELDKKVKVERSQYLRTIIKIVCGVGGLFVLFHLFKWLAT